MGTRNGAFGKPPSLSLDGNITIDGNLIVTGSGTFGSLVTTAGWQVKDDGSGNLEVVDPSGNLIGEFLPNGESGGGSIFQLYDADSGNTLAFCAGGTPNSSATKSTVSVGAVGNLNLDPATGGATKIGVQDGTPVQLGGPVTYLNTVANASGTNGVTALRTQGAGTGATTAKAIAHTPTANVTNHGYWAYVNVTAITGSIGGTFTWTDEAGNSATDTLLFRHMETGTQVTSIVAMGHYIALNPGVTSNNSAGVITLTITPTDATFNYEMYITGNR